MLILHDKKVIFLHNPRTAGKTIKRWLEKNAVSFQSFSKLPTRITPDLGHLHLHNYKDYVQEAARNNYTHIVFVRDVFERFHYGYIEMTRHDISREYMRENAIQSKEDLIEHLYEDFQRVYDPRLVWVCPQYLFVFDEHDRQIPYVYHFNNISESLSSISKWLEIPSCPFEFQDYGNNLSYDDWRLRELYKKDFEMLQGTRMVPDNTIRGTK